MINITAGIQHLKEMTAFYKREGEEGSGLEEDLKMLNDKLRRMYDVVKNDPNYMRQNYKASASAIQTLMKEQQEYRSYRPQHFDEDEEDPQD